jgi:hypothetical protein
MRLGWHLFFLKATGRPRAVRLDLFGTPIRRFLFAACLRRSFGHPMPTPPERTVLSYESYVCNERALYSFSRYLQLAAGPARHNYEAIRVTKRKPLANTYKVVQNKDEEVVREWNAVWATDMRLAGLYRR